jgi:hypothetical protein
MDDGIYIAIGILGVILFVLHNYKLTKKRQDTEKKYLKKHGLTHSEIVYDPELCLPSSEAFGTLQDLVVSNNELNLAISSSKFIRTYPQIGWDTARIFSFSSSKGKEFPVFRLEPKRDFSMYDIKYDESSDFSKLFTLTAQNWTERTGFGMDTNQGENYNKVRELFENTALQKHLLAEMVQLYARPISIQSNGKRIFYYWTGWNVAVQRFEGVILELKKLHNKYFDD